MIDWFGSFAIAPERGLCFYLTDRSDPTDRSEMVFSLYIIINLR